MALRNYFNGKTKKIKIDFPAKCNSNCIGCFTHVTDCNPNIKLSVKTAKKIVDSASDNNYAQLVIAGLGEPLIDKKYFFKIAKYANRKGLEIILYSNGTYIDEQTAKKLFDLNLSILVKRNSMNHKKQSRFMNANVPFLSELNLAGIKNLIKIGFNKDRFALESFVSKQNYKDLCNVLRFCRKNNIMPYFEEFISVNQAKDIKNKMILARNELIKSFKMYQKIDRDEFKINAQLEKNSRRYLINKCFANKMLTIDVNGNIKRCILDEILGNIYQDNFSKIQNKLSSKCPGCSNMVIQKLS